MASDQVFSTPRAARRARTLAMEPARPGAGIASAAGDKVKEFKGQLRQEEWQADAYRHANAIGELGYVLGLIGSTVAKGQLVVTEVDENGTPVPVEKRDDGTPILEGKRAAAERVLNCLAGPDGDHKAILAATAVHDQTAGEAILIGTPVEGEPNQTTWEVVSVLEIVQDRNTGKLMRKRSARKASTLSVASNTETEHALDTDTYLARYHRSDWAHSGDATSPLRRNAGVCKQVLRLDQLVDTTIDSRLAAGILLVPEEVTFTGPDDEYPEDVEDTDILLEMIAEQVGAPILDPRSQAALVPVLIRSASDYIDKFKLLSLSDGSMDLETVLAARRTALRRLAAGIDVPLEVMEGMGSTSHWNAVGIDTDTVKKHVIPLGDRLARFFETSYFRRMLIAFEEFSEEEAARFSLAYDGSDILSRTDVATSADALHSDGLISDDARVSAHGFDPDEVRPTQEEGWRRIIEKLSVVPHQNNRPLLAGLDIDWVAMGIPQDVIDEFLTIPATTEALDGDDDDEPVDDPEPPPLPVEDAGRAEPETDNADAELALRERIRATAAMAVDRALERAANQVVTRSKKLPADTRGRVDQPHYRTGRRKTEVLTILGEADWRAIKLTPETMVRDAFNDFSDVAVSWLRDSYQQHSDAYQADEDARRAVSTLVRMLDAHTLTAFRTPIRREDGLAVPMSLVDDALGVGVTR